MKPKEPANPINVDANYDPAKNREDKENDEKNANKE